MKWIMDAISIKHLSGFSNRYNSKIYPKGKGYLGISKSGKEMEFQWSETRSIPILCYMCITQKCKSCTILVLAEQKTKFD